MTLSIPRPPGLREHKRQQTLQRIAQVGLELFLAKGYEATTLDEIAAAAGISRRTIFYYFSSKDSILFAYMRVYTDAIRDLVATNMSGGQPLDIVFAALSTFITGSENARMLATAQLMRQSPIFRSRPHGGYLQIEQAIYEGLCQRYPDKPRDGLKLTAMVSIGPLRLATEMWLQKDGAVPLAICIQDAVAKLRAELSTWPGHSR